MSPPERKRPAALPPEALNALPGLPRDEGGPVFAELWHAQAFAMTVKLHEAGAFSWKEWSQALGAEFAEAQRQGRPDDGSRYYEHWLAALEKLIAAKGLLDSGALRLRREDWERAYRNTPHGQPVHLPGTDAADIS